MELAALTDQHEIKQAIVQLKTTLRRDAERPRLMINTPGGQSKCFVMWHKPLQLWSTIYLESSGTRYWCCYGMRDPAETRVQRPIVEINPPVEGKNVHCQGTFARDADGNVYYHHTGRIGGGRTGIGKATFIGSELYKGASAVVSWPDGSHREMYVIGKLGDASLVENLATYVRAVAMFRVMRGAHGRELVPLFNHAPPIFVSHCHEDNGWCRDFVRALRSAGANAWYDEHDLGHGILRNEIERQLRDRPVFIVILSPAALTSHWVSEEMDAAKSLEQEQPERIMLPVMAEKCEVPLFWRRYKWIGGPDDAGLPATQAAGRVIQALTSR